MTLLAYIIVVLFFLTVWHFVYENILAPSFRMRLRYKVFALRDDLRRECENFEGEETQILQSQINTALNEMSSFNISLAMYAKRFVLENPDEFQEYAKKVKVVELSSSDRVRQITKELNRIMRFVFVVNSGGWLVYLVPIAVVLVLFKRVKDAAKIVLNLPERAFKRQQNSLNHNPIY